MALYVLLLGYPISEKLFILKPSSPHRDPILIDTSANVKILEHC
jgi:hypothetical protein